MALSHIKQADMLDMRTGHLHCHITGIVRNYFNHTKTPKMLLTTAYVKFHWLPQREYIFYFIDSKNTFLSTKRYTLKEILAVLRSLFRITKTIWVHDCLQRDYINHNTLELVRNLKNHPDQLLHLTEKVTHLNSKASGSYLSLYINLRFIHSNDFEVYFQFFF